MMLIYLFSDATMDAKLGQVKRYFKIDQHLARHFVYFAECLSSPPPFPCSQIITSFLNLRISINKEKGLKFKPIVKSLYPYSCFTSSVEFLLPDTYKLKILFYLIYKNISSSISLWLRDSEILAFFFLAYSFMNRFS